MSTSWKIRPSRSRIVSTVSRVVPGTSETMTRSAPTRALSSDDLPTLGRPRIATRIASSPTCDRALAGEQVDDAVEQVAGAVAVQGGERERVAEAELVELDRLEVLARVVDLVREHDHRLLRGPQGDRQLLVARRDPVPGVDDEEDEVGLRDRRARLLRDLGAERVGGEVVDAARVDQEEVLAVPVREQLLAVAGDAGRLVHDRLPRLGQPVDQRRLADVREADDRDRADDLGLLDLGGLGRLAHDGGVARSGRPSSCISPSQSCRPWIRFCTSAEASR